MVRVQCYRPTLDVNIKVCRDSFSLTKNVQRSLTRNDLCNTILGSK